MIYGSVLIATWLVFSLENYVANPVLYLKALLVALVCQTCLYYNDLYDLTVIDSFLELGIRLLQALGAAAIFLAGIYFLLPGAIIGRGIFALSIAITIGCGSIAAI